MLYVGQPTLHFLCFRIFYEFSDPACPIAISQSLFQLICNIFSSLTYKQGICANGNQFETTLNPGNNCISGCTKYPKRYFFLFCTFLHFHNCILNLGIGCKPDFPHTCRQVVWSNEQAVNAGYFDDVFDVAHGISMLNLNNNSSLFVGGCYIFLKIFSVSTGSRSPNTSHPFRGILTKLNHQLCFFSCLNIWNDNSRWAHIKCFFYPYFIERWHANHTRHLLCCRL